MKFVNLRFELVCKHKTTIRSTKAHSTRPEGPGICLAQAEGLGKGSRSVSRANGPIGCRAVPNDRAVGPSDSVVSFSQAFSLG